MTNMDEKSASIYNDFPAVPNPNDGLAFAPPSGPPPPPKATAASPTPQEFTDEDAEVLFSDFQRAPANCNPLRVPLCIPQVTSGNNSTFVRAYSEELRASGVEMGDLLKFVDALNIAITASPPLRIVDVAGLIIGFVPYHWCIIAGAAMQTVAQTGIAVIAKTLTDRLLRRANEEYFGPRGLRVRICTNKAMRQLVGIDQPPAANAKEESKMHKFAVKAGVKAEGVALMLPIVRKVYNLVAPPVPRVDMNSMAAAGMSPSDPTHAITLRRLMPLQGYIQTLNFSVPPAPPPDKIMDKASNMSMKLSLWFTKRQNNKDDLRRRLLAQQRGEYIPGPGGVSSASSSFYSSSSSSSSNPLERILDARQQRKDQRMERRSMRRGGVNDKLQMEVEIADRKEHNKTKQLLWVVVVNADQDSFIQGKEVVDNHEDYERVPAEEWKQELEKEKEVYKANLQQGSDDMDEYEEYNEKDNYANPPDYRRY